MTIYITRHGQSMTNVDRDVALRGDAKRPVPLNVRNNVLTEVGIVEAMNYGRWLERSEADVRNIVCSPYARTKQTAYCIASMLPNLPMIHYDRGVREIDWDVGLSFDRLENHIPGFDSRALGVGDKPLVDRKRGAITLESQQEVYDRAVPAFARAVRRYAKRGNLLIVTHYFVVRALMAFIEEGSSEAMLRHSPTNLMQLYYENAAVLRRLEEVGL